MDNFRKVYEQHFDTVWHICLAYMKNKHDAEDALQETFLRYIKFCQRKPKAFAGDCDEICFKKTRTWLIVTAGNVCKDQLKSWWNKREQLNDFKETAANEDEDISDVLLAVMKLPDKYKIPIYMYYYMGYNSNEIAMELGVLKSTMRSNLSRARELLKQELKKGGAL